MGCIIVVWVLSLTCAFGQGKADAAHQALWELNFDQIPFLVKPLQNTDAYHWLMAYQAFLKTLTSTSTVNTTKTITVIDASASALKKSKHPYAANYLAVCYLYRSYLQYTQGNYWAAANDYYSAVNQNLTEGTDHETLAIKNQIELVKLLAGFYYNGVPIVGSVQGKRKKAEAYKVKCLELANHTGLTGVNRAETMVLALLLYQFIEPDEMAVYRLANTCLKEVELSPLVVLTQAKIAHRAKQFKEYEGYLMQAMVNNYEQRLNQFNLEFGINLANKADTLALGYLNQYCTNQTNGKNVTYAWLKMGWLYYINGHNASAQLFVNKILDHNNITTDEERQAYYEASNSINWTPELIRSRMYFDIGYYTRAEQLLLKSKPDVEHYTKAQKLEMAYRLGRCYQALENAALATRFYNMAITSGLDYQFYYPAYAAYYMAQMLYQKGQHQQAETYVNQCLKLDSPIYKESIHQKARLLKQYHQP